MTPRLTLICNFCSNFLTILAHHTHTICTHCGTHLQLEHTPTSLSTIILANTKKQKAIVNASLANPAKNLNLIDLEKRRKTLHTALAQLSITYKGFDTNEDTDTFPKEDRGISNLAVGLITFIMGLVFFGIASENLLIGFIIGTGISLSSFFKGLFEIYNAYHYNQLLITYSDELEQLNEAIFYLNSSYL